MRTLIVSLLLFLWLPLSEALPALCAQTDDPAKLTVTKDKLSFDPKTCKEGSGGITTGVGGARVKILGQKDGQCEFEYVTDGCGGCFAYYRCKVPVDSGPVTVAVVNGSIKTSFPLEKMKLLRTTGPAVTVLVGDTGEYVTYRPGERRSEMEPRKGDKVKFRCRVYDGPEFKQHLPNAAFDLPVEFVVGAGQAWPWLETAMEHMTVGDKRQVHVPMQIADGAAKWHPDPKAKILYVELNLVSLERGK